MTDYYWCLCQGSDHHLNTSTCSNLTLSGEAEANLPITIHLVGEWQYINILKVLNFLCVKGHQEVPRIVKNCHGSQMFTNCFPRVAKGLPRDVKGVQGLPRIVKDYQGSTRTINSRQRSPKVAKGCQRLPRVAKGCQGSPRVEKHSSPRFS